MRIPILGNIQEDQHHDLQALHAAAKVLNQKIPFENQQSLFDFLRGLEEAQVVWDEYGIQPDQLQRAINLVSNDIQVQVQLIKKPDSGEVVVPPVDPPPVENGGSSSGMVFMFLILAGLILLFATQGKKQKGLAGTEEEAKPDPGTIPVILNGPTKAKRKKTISIQI